MTLSNILSEAIEQALHDLELCNNDPSYIIDFSTWHETTPSQFSNKCSVCFAGGIMAKTLAADKAEDYVPSDFPDHKNMLNALDCIRCGEITLALDSLSIKSPDGLPSYVKVNQDDYDEFVKDMNKIIVMLKEHNL